MLKKAAQNINETVKTTELIYLTYLIQVKTNILQIQFRLSYSKIFFIIPWYYVFHILPQIYTATHANFPIQM